MGLFKKVAGKVLEKIISKPKTEAEIDLEIKQLAPRAQWLAGIARPVISISLVYVLIIGVFIQWIQQMLNVNIIIIPDYIIQYSKIIVGVHVGTRGLEKIVTSIFGKG